MSTSSAAAEQRLLQNAERRYRRRGYKVLLRPRGDDLPQFLSGFEPDMIAYNDQESVVVAVKPRADLPAAEYLMELANVVNGQQGWRLDLAVVNPKTPPLVDEDVEVLGQTEIVARIRAVRQLVKERQDEAAILLAWSTVEAALRLLADQQDIALENDQSAYVIKTLYSLGVLGQEDYGPLEKGYGPETSSYTDFGCPNRSRALPRHWLAKSKSCSKRAQPTWQDRTRRGSKRTSPLPRESWRLCRTA